MNITVSQAQQNCKTETQQYLSQNTNTCNCFRQNILKHRDIRD